MDFLTAEQNARFADVNARLGLGPEEFTAALSPDELAALPAVRRMSSTPDSDFPLRFVSIGSVEEMRKLVGNDEFVAPTNGSEPDYPSPPSPAEIDRLLNAIRNQQKPQVSPELMASIHQAAIAYVVGNPAKVQAFVPLINALLYPGRVAVFTGDTLDVPRGATHMITGDDPLVLNFGRITVAKDATIKVNSRTFISSQVFSTELGTSLDAPTYTIENIGEPWAGPAQQGGTGATGPAQTGTGTDGASNYNNSNCQWVCTTQPGNGPTGNAGGTGLTGTTGAQGHPSAGGVYKLGLITTPITMLIGAGDGQQGGKGGTGGDGGPGGSPGKAATGCTNTPSKGGQGAGGQGGNGGPGGPGGESGFVTVYFSYNGPSQDPIAVTVRTVAGGAGGAPGDPGAGPTNLGQGNVGTPPGAQGPIPKFALNQS